MQSSFRRARRPCLVSGLATVAGLLAPTLLSATATATPQPPLVISSDKSLEGDLGIFESFTVAAGVTVTVPPYVAGTHPGYLQIQANTITIDAGASIVADGAGYPGVAGMNGLCFPMTNCAGAGTMAGDPGGGGGYFAQGADGMSEVDGGCVDLGVSASGGQAFTPVLKAMGVTLGSAGGASNLGGSTLATEGAAGGGGIRLSAGLIVLDGTLSANGGPSNAFGGAAPGGGSGGTIVVLAGKLSGTGTFSVLGGDGAHSDGISGTFSPNDGGGGSGGIVMLTLPPGADTSTFTFALGGGKTGTCGSPAGGPRGNEAQSPLPGGKTCVDLDGDSYTSTACGGKDCDDEDPTIHPGAKEICNGKDDNCNGVIDEAPNNCTTMGLICVNAACVAPPPDGGTVDAGGDGGLPDHIDLTGGCHVPEGLPEQGGAVLALGIAAMALAASRRRGARREK